MPVNRGFYVTPANFKVFNNAKIKQIKPVNDTSLFCFFSHYGHENMNRQMKSEYVLSIFYFLHSGTRVLSLDI